MLYIGTSGYFYPEWKGVFYPRALKSCDFLKYYQRSFNAVEINATFYKNPTIRQFQNMTATTDSGFRFVVKLNKAFTHDRKLKLNQVALFKAPLLEMAKEKRLACVLAQFPYAFHKNRENMAYLSQLKQLFSEFALVVEFRNQKWLSEDVFLFLQRHSIGFCNVDEPPLKGLIPKTHISTAPIGYVRFHGRNSGNWWQPETPSARYDYRYSLDELTEWVPKIQALDQACEQTFVFTNNHFQGKAVFNALDLKKLLGVCVVPKEAIFQLKGD